MNKRVKSKLTQLARNLRTQSTKPERLLWRHLKAKQLEGLKFRRQQPIGKYIVDFVCFEKRVIVELDGSQHMTQEKQDHERDTFLRKSGFIVLRFWNNDVLEGVDAVYEVIRKQCFSRPSP